MSKQQMAVNLMDLQGNLATGTIQLPINQARIIASNDIGVVNATDGGAVAKDTDPLLERSNGATDKGLRLSWASPSVIEIQLPVICYPPDLDDAAPVVVHVLAAMKAGSVNTPVIAVGAFEGVGDANAGGNTAALSTTVQDLTVTLAAADVGVAPKALALTLKPAAHATASNDVYVYGAFVTYTRKF